MIRPVLFIVFAFLTTTSTITAQKKKDLLEEISKLKQELKSVQSDLVSAKKQVNASESKVKGMETQVAELKATNTSLLSNMSSFTELSNKKASNLQKSQEIIKEKDRQLNAINDALTQNDSINLAVYSKLKNALGGDYLKISKGTIFLAMPNDVLFGDTDKSISVEDKAKTTLEKLAGILTKDPELKVIIEGNSNAIKFDETTALDNWDLSSRQAAAVARTLQTEYEIDPKRLYVVGKGETGTSAIETVTRIIIDPQFEQFYAMVKDNMKNSK
ncbi:OmpA family protein [Aquimarina sp. ERC-38]|uniref:OmpA family protein n=1 Tax=Aquimarina sp. ERC-38 TaxID=2949996 RepID=UPI0022457304|nr:OmpA family protein [Aquimarina sp. ERC-38]UZO80363.1 OmpA family protein [Aquimarina sp. ERC-38]